MASLWSGWRKFWRQRWLRMRLALRRFRARRAKLAPDHPHELGAWGEARAWKVLRKNGAKLLKANFRAQGGGEADLVVRDGGVLAFVEVKTRRSVVRGRPAVAVNRDKSRLLQRAARGWLRMLGRSAREVPWRVDVVEVLVSEQGGVEEIRWNKGLEERGRK